MNIYFPNRYNNALFVVAGLILSGYLFWGTGLHGDDMSTVLALKEIGFSSFIYMKKVNGLLMMPSGYYLFWWAYVFLGPDTLWVYDAVKWLSSVLSIILVYRFALDYLPSSRAILMALLFVFNPVHEVTMYWYMTATYVLTPSIIMLSHHYVRHEKYVKGFLLGCLGSFMYYVSPPYGIGLAVIFLLERSYKKALIFILPALLYIGYYFIISITHPSAEHRITHGMSVGHLMKTYLLQIPAFFDSFIGPSYWLKVFYSIGAIDFFSLFLALLVIFFMIKNFRPERSQLSLSLLGGLIAVLSLSFCIYAIADILGHRTFNLGNRLSVYGSLLIAFLAASIPSNRILWTILAICFVLPTFGLSDHWKLWNVTQNQIISRVKNNQNLINLSQSDTLLVKDNMYSKLGPFSHIDFFNMPWNVDAIFKPIVKTENIIPLNTYTHFDGRWLSDKKSGGRVEIVNNIYLYKSASDILIKISPEQLPEILANRPREIRHWVQFFKDTWIETAITRLSPRLSFLFEKF